MRMWLLYTWIGVVFLGGCAISQAQTNKKGYKLEIKQYVSGAYSQSTFTITGDKLVIYQTTSTKQGKTVTKKVYLKKIKSDILDKIKQLSSQLFDLKSSYVKSELDGIRWEINVEEKGKSKSIVIKSQSIKEITNLFDEINEIIPKRKPHIYKY